MARRPISAGSFRFGRSPTQLMDYCLVLFPPQLAQEPSHLPLRVAHLLACLLLRDQFLVGLLQGH